MLKTRRYAVLIAAALASVALSWPEAAAARADGPFASFLGSWRGRGQVVTSDGKVESITCKASYDVSESGATLTQSLVCASDSYRFDIKCNVIADGTSIEGGWQETTRNVAGNLTGTIKDGLFQGNVDGAGFTAGVVLRTSRKDQAVTITPHAGSVTKIEVSLKKGE